MPPRVTRGGPSRGTPPQRGGGRGGRGGRGGGRGGAPREGPALVGRGPSAGQPVLQGGSTSTLPGHLESVGVKRPGYGTRGMKTKAIVNALEMRMPEDLMIYHYDVATLDKTYPQRFNVQLIKTLQHDTAPDVFTPAGAYDGKKNLFMPQRLDLGSSDSRVFDVVLPANGHPRDRPPPTYRVKITFAAQINSTVLDRFIHGLQSHDEQVLTAITALNVIIRTDPIMNHPFNVRSFFPMDGEKRAIGHGFELVRGYFQSVRPTLNKLLINVDISSGLFFKPGPLIQVIFDFFALGSNANPQMLSPGPQGLDPRRRQTLQHFLKGVRVSVAPSNRIVVVNKISDVGANNYRFQLREGGQTTVAEYFRSQQNRPLQYPQIACIVTAKGAAIPFEKCTVVPGQIARKQIPPELTKEMVEFSRKTPSERMASIRTGFTALAYGQSEYIRSFRLAINTGPFPEIDARVLAPPKLKYANRVTVQPRFGSWNMADKKFIKPVDIARWAVVVYESERRMTSQRVQGLIKDYVDACASVGVTVHERDPVVRYYNAQGDITEQLRSAGRDCAQKNRGVGGPDLLVVILPEHGNTDIYRAVKHFGDCVMGVATQCLKSNNCMRAKMQYWANVCLKVNPKLGGINVVPDASSAPILVDPNNPTIILGGDTMHPPPNSTTPSFTAVVGNVDTEVSKYIATSRVQTSRMEIIEDLYSMVKSIIENYRGYRQSQEQIPPAKSAPKRLIFFRDGVSEGQFAQVKEQELAVIRQVCMDLKISVAITFVVVGKRHHYRFQPRAGEGDRTGNMPAGTVIDTGITDPVMFDFYLNSHGGLIGTNRPSHYSVLHDDNRFSPDAIQDLCYTLCHVYARSTRSVSIPAPVYYADIVCGRAKNHFSPQGSIDLSDTATQASGSAAGRDLEAYKTNYKPVAGTMAKRMYFM